MSRFPRRSDDAGQEFAERYVAVQGKARRVWHALRDESVGVEEFKLLLASVADDLIEVKTLRLQSRDEEGSQASHAQEPAKTADAA